MEGPYVSGFKGTTARGFVIRGNQLENHAEIFLRGSVHDVLVEHNVVRRSPRGVFADLAGRQDGVLLCDNRFEDVPEPLVPKEVPRGYSVIDNQSK